MIIQLVIVYCTSLFAWYIYLWLLHLQQMFLILFTSYARSSNHNPNWPNMYLFDGCICGNMCIPDLAFYCIQLQITVCLYIFSFTAVIFIKSILLLQNWNSGVFCFADTAQKSWMHHMWQTLHFHRWLQETYQSPSRCVSIHLSTLWQGLFSFV